MDPSLNQKYAVFLKKKICTSPKDDISEAPMDPESYERFDKSYYENLLRNKGLFESDAALTTNSKGRSAINGILRVWSYGKITVSVYLIYGMNMGQIGVLYDEQGEVRVNCGRIN
ncbi:peroxidase [Ranunculus cassubicifolius]